jgi:hypothetical protein
VFASGVIVVPHTRVRPTPVESQVPVRWRFYQSAHGKGATRQGWFSTNRRTGGAPVGEYAVWLAEQPLSPRTREAYLGAVAAFAG